MLDPVVVDSVRSGRRGYCPSLDLLQAGVIGSDVVNEVKDVYHSVSRLTDVGRHAFVEANDFIFPTELCSELLNNVNKLSRWELK